MLAALRRTWMPATLLAWASAWFIFRYGHSVTDWNYFRAAARSILADGVPPLPGGPLHLYAEMPGLQFGPPVVAVMLPTLAVSPSAARLLGAGAMVLVGLLSLWAISACARRMGVRPRPATVLITGLLLIPPWITLSVTFMHLDDVIALGCLCLALRFLVTEHAVAAGLLLGVGGASKPWAVMFWALIFVLPRRAWPTAALGCVVVATACWAPFLIADPFTGSAISHIRTSVHDDSTLRLLHLAGQTTPNWLRPMQFVVGTAVIAGVIWRGRWVAAPLAGVAVRLVTDGSTYAYYGTAAVLTAAIWDVLAQRRLPIATTGAVLIEFALPAVLPDPLMAAIRLLAGLLLLAALLQPQHERDAALEPVPASVVAIG